MVHLPYEGERRDWVMGQHSNDKVERSPRALWWAVTLSAIWVVLLSVAVAWSKSCAPDAAFWQVGSRFLSCLSANEIGDFLAGASAPLAFIWLVVTVLVQAQELRAQRKELALTRREFELNRRVAEETQKAVAEQAEATRRNAEFVGKQTEILDHQFEQGKQLESDAEFSALLDQLDTFLRTRFTERAGWSSGAVKIDWQPMLYERDYGSDRDTRLATMSSNFFEDVDHMRRYYGLTNLAVDAATAGLLKQLSGHLELLLIASKEVSPALLALEDTLELSRLSQTVEEIQKDVAYITQ